MNIFEQIKAKYRRAKSWDDNLDFKIILVLIVLLVPSYFGYKYYNDQKKLTDKLGCESFEDCLSKYKFEGAYHYYEEIEDKPFSDEKYFSFKKLISAQVNYWCNQKDFQKAYTVLNEHTMMATYNLKTDDESDNDEYNEEAGFMNSQLEYIIGQMLVNGEEKTTIVKYAKSLKPIVVGNVNDKSIFGGYDSYVLSNQPYDAAVFKINKK
jgi:hypothetical protein